MPPATTGFVIVGLTNGPGFHPNPCLAAQLDWVRRYHVRLGGYALTSYPTRHDLRVHGSDGPYDVGTGLGRLRNAAYAEARFNLSTMRRVGLYIPMLWVDVEPYPLYPWSSSYRGNRAVIATVIQVYRDAGLEIGIYSNPAGWPAVVGGWRLPGYPTWVTAGPRDEQSALGMCSHGPSGGRAWIAQWWFGHYKVGVKDRDVLCPGITPSRAFRD